MATNTNSAGDAAAAATAVPTLETTVDVTVCFCDLAGFAQACVGKSPATIAGELNDHLQAITAVVVAHGGIPVKYIGDAMLCFFWGPYHQRRAVAAALELTLPDRPNVGVGLSSGPVFYGRIGHSDYARADIVGETVNLAARAEAQSSHYARRVAATGELTDALAGGVTLGTDEIVEMKGIGRSLRLCEVRGAEPL